MHDVITPIFLQILHFFRFLVIDTNQKYGKDYQPISEQGIIRADVTSLIICL